LGRLGLDEGVVVIFNGRSVAPPIDERAGFEEGADAVRAAGDVAAA
jgi:hypothetical protein